MRTLRWVGWVLAYAFAAPLAVLVSLVLVRRRSTVVRLQPGAFAIGVMSLAAAESVAIRVCSRVWLGTSRTASWELCWILGALVSTCFAAALLTGLLTPRGQA